MSFLDKIRPGKEQHAKMLRNSYTVHKAMRPGDFPIRDFPKALTGGGRLTRLIAEIKAKSPSHPAFRQPASPASLARFYRRNGAAALSIVVDAEHFGTSLSDVAAVKAAVDLPVLTKDFIVAEEQISEAWAAGADAVLLIVGMLDEGSLKRLLAFAHGLGLHVLVECHDRREIELAGAAGASIVGVNNRNLATLETDLSHGAGMLPHLSANVIRVSESGLYSRDDILTMAGHGADAFLVGHALLQHPDPGRKVAELSGKEDAGALRIKICGITNVDDARSAHDAGADILGLICAESPRRVSLDSGRAIRKALPNARLCGVFVDPRWEDLTAAVANLDLDMIQLHGEESPDFVRKVRDHFGCPVNKALTPDQATPERVAAYDAAAYILVDLPKGTDKHRFTFADCQRAAAPLIRAGHSVFLAGGLNPGNVKNALTAPFPFAVDIAGGVEAEPGVKDPHLIQQFIAEARS